MASDLSKYTIGWITALPIELAAATVMLDEEHPEPPLDEHDTTLYTFGSIGRHNVVIACLPGGQTGLSAATAVATQMRNKFKTIKVGFMVGIGGGVPSEKADIRLGDVVVSLPYEGHGGVVQYDSGKAEADGKFRPTGHLNTPPKLLLAVVNRARSNYLLGRSTYAKHLAKFNGRAFLKTFSRSSAGPDMLFQSIYNHAGGATCKDCKPEMLVERPPRDDKDSSDRVPSIKIHFGTIASGNKVMKDAKARDEISEQFGGHLLCFEMEAAGLMNDFPCLVVRGICDYSDSHKQDNWQGYAAATAAAYTKELLLLTPSAGVSSLDSIKPSDPVPAAEVASEVPFYVPFDRNPDFVGRGDILLELDRLMSPLNKRTRAAIWGLGGCGKSAVALEFLYRVHTREPGRTIFWIRASGRHHYKTGFRNIAILYGIPGALDPKQDIMRAVKTKLMDQATPKWLIVVDNADDPEVLLSEDDLDGQRLKDYLPSRADCQVLFTTRDKHAATRLVGVSDPVLVVESFGVSEAQQLLTAIAPNARSTNDACIKELLTELTCLPLAIVQAAAFMRENDVDVGTYLNLFRKQNPEDESTDVLGQEFEDGSRYPKIGNALTIIWRISFYYLGRRNHLALDCLKVLACFACTDIPETLITAHTEISHLEHVKIIGLLVGYQFLVRQRQGSLFDTHRLVHLATKRWLSSTRQWPCYFPISVAGISKTIPYGGYHKHNEYSRYLPHGICLLSHIDNVKLNTENEATTDLLSRIAACQRDLGDHNSAEQSHRAVLRWREMHLKEFDKKTLQAMQDVGQDLMLKGLYSDAESMHRKTFGLRFRYFGLADVETLTSMRNIAESLGFQCKWEEYEILSTELAKLSRAWLGLTHTVTLSSLKALSTIYCYRGWYTLAEKLARDVVDGRTKAERLGETHPSTLMGISHLAWVLGYSNKWAEAEPLESPRIWVRLDRLSEARDMFQEIYSARLNLLGPEHPDTLKSTYVDPPKNIIWTGIECEGEMLCPPLELDTRILETTDTDEPENSSNTTAMSEDEEAAAKQWSGPWTQIERKGFRWNSTVDPYSTIELTTSLLPNLMRVDRRETWTWLRNNTPGLKLQPTAGTVARRSIVPSGLPLRHVSPMSLSGRWYDHPSGSRSNAGPTSIFRAPLSGPAIFRPPIISTPYREDIKEPLINEPHYLDIALKQVSDPMAVMKDAEFSITPGQRILLGSDPFVDIDYEPLDDDIQIVKIEDDIVSNRHCEIWNEDRKWYVRDLGSLTNTYLNGELLGT
ncbi:purine and uridine phosphorylase [Aureobasidium pullulans]|uniref:Purine and uridine phosphorylase n=1 Tax=Aureobasidium pullulans TaxID=5580 RepID=A0A4S9L2E4_AURPU|nr:purine and uridine phosphorylase [Aureobasidium pullulans]